MVMFMGGFESAAQRRRDGVRLDLLRATAHDRHASSDYRQCSAVGLPLLRDGVRWHRIETHIRRYDWSSWQMMLAAACESDVRIIWNLHHYGTPDHIALAGADFAEAFAQFAAAAAELHRRETGLALLSCPVNEISFHAWAVGEGYFPTTGVRDAAIIKRQLVSAALAARAAIRQVEPEAKFYWSEPLVHVARRHEGRAHRREAEEYRLAQFEAYDMLLGRLCPELGGEDDVVESIGLNFYPHNQWYYRGPTIPLGHHAYRPLSEMLGEVASRYGRSIWLAETGAEGSARPAWLHYICDEIRAAAVAGAAVSAICLYPVTHYPGWDNGRRVQTGLFGEWDGEAGRPIYQPLLQELDRQRQIMAKI